MHRFTIAALALACMSGTMLAQEAKTETPAQQPATEALPTPADCTLTKAQLCKADGGCAESASLGDLALPARVLVHYTDRVIASTSADGLPHVSTVDTLSSVGDNLTLQGVDGLTGWIVQTSKSEDGVSFTVVSHEVVLTAFGTCQATH
ncbi:hypothetical protein [Taklimakanibacter deserti]|uniref:hypothetical protein n=1 Tax=Taklimakanibacter deserti TaxID=2267839 RepID=UPI000E64C554